MEFGSKLTAAALIFMFTFLLNLPFGYLRDRSKKYSLKWILYIHLPVPFVFFARIMAQLELKYVPLFLVAAILGQFIGGKVKI